MNRILLVAAIVLFVLALVCLIAPTTIAGADWPTWLVAALLSWMLDQLLSPYIKSSRSACPTPSATSPFLTSCPDSHENRHG